MLSKKLNSAFDIRKPFAMWLSKPLHDQNIKLLQICSRRLEQVYTVLQRITPFDTGTYVCGKLPQIARHVHFPLSFPRIACLNLPSHPVSWTFVWPRWTLNKPQRGPATPEQSCRDSKCYKRWNHHHDLKTWKAGIFQVAGFDVFLGAIVAGGIEILETSIMLLLLGG